MQQGSLEGTVYTIGSNVTTPIPDRHKGHPSRRPPQGRTYVGSEVGRYQDLQSLSLACDPLLLHKQKGDWCRKPSLLPRHLSLFQIFVVSPQMTHPNITRSSLSVKIFYSFTYPSPSTIPFCTLSLSVGIGTPNRHSKCGASLNFLFLPYHFQPWDSNTLTISSQSAIPSLS